MKTVQQGHTVTLTLTLYEWTHLSAIHASLDSAHQTYFAQGKTPGLIEAQRIWKGLMGAWGEFRMARGL